LPWKIEFSAGALKEIQKLDRTVGRRISKFTGERLARLEDPRSIGEALQGKRFGEFWRYRVGNYRLICKIEDDRLVVLVLRIGHRREIYR
jgi:mRNA interferase RelE/StbE